MDGLRTGRIVDYILTDSDSEAINRRRIDPGQIHYEMGLGKWPMGAQAHVGNRAYLGDHVPAMIVRVWSSDGMVDLKCFLDGNDDYWVTSVQFDAGKKIEKTDLLEYSYGQWHWLEKA